MNSQMATTRSANPNLREQLQRLGLRTVATQLDDMLAYATRERSSPRQVLEQMMQIEMSERSQRSLERRLRRADIGKFKPLADFEWDWPDSIERGVIEQAMTLDFLVEARNLILVGTNGLGKTMIAQNICHAAVLAGHSVCFRKVSELLLELHRQTPEGRLRKFRAYANVALLCIDEVGYASYDDKAADLLYEIINRRYEKRSVILTTNEPFQRWNTVFPNAACIATMLDRLLHHAEITTIQGESYRVHESAKESTARREKSK
jgi:DNA replication protein DnaC